MADNENSSDVTLTAPRLTNRHSPNYSPFKSCQTNEETQTDVRTNSWPVRRSTHRDIRRTVGHTSFESAASPPLPFPCYCVSEGLSLKRAITCICVQATERALWILTTRLPFRQKYERVSGTSISGDAGQPVLSSPLQLVSITHLFPFTDDVTNKHLQNSWRTQLRNLTLCNFVTEDGSLPEFDAVFPCLVLDVSKAHGDFIFRDPEAQYNLTGSPLQFKKLRSKHSCTLYKPQRT